MRAECLHSVQLSLQGKYVTRKMAIPPYLYPSRLLDQSFGMCITPQDLILPYNNYQTSNYYRPWKWYLENMKKDFGSTIEDEKNKFQITLDVQHFKPNEITVKVINKDILVECKHEERLDEHGYISRQFTRRYRLPVNCDPEDITSNLSSDGILMIIATKKNTKILSNEISVPIKLCASFSTKHDMQSREDDSIKTSTVHDDSVNMKPSTNIKAEEQILNKSNSKVEDETKLKCQIMLKEDNSHLKSEIQSISAAETIMESKVETDFKMSETKMGESVNSATATDDTIKMSVEKIGQSSIAAALDESFKMSSEKLGMSSKASTSEVSSYSTMSSETMKSEEISSSYVSSSLKATSGQSSETLRDSISAALKEAADIL